MGIAPNNEERVLMKGCVVEGKNENMDDWGCRKFVVDQIRGCEKVLKKLKGEHLTLSGEKSTFRQEEILVLGHLCGRMARDQSRSMQFKL